MDSMQSVTSKDAANGATYLSVMEQNLSVLKAVSYTHLDVYKRQVKVTAFARITKDMQRGAISQEDTRRAKDYVRDLLYDALRCLLYTSRCV